MQFSSIWPLDLFPFLSICLIWGTNQKQTVSLCWVLTDLCSNPAPVYNHDSFWSVSQEQTQSQLAPVGALVGELGRGAAHGWRARLHPPPRPPQSERPPRDVHHQRAQLPEALGHSRETRGTRRSASCHHATVHTKGGGGGFYSHWRQTLLSFTYTMVSFPQICLI